MSSEYQKLRDLLNVVRNLPWRRGGQCVWDDVCVAHELPTGTDIWAEDGPVTEAKDWLRHEEIELIVQAVNAAPALLAEVDRLKAEVAQLYERHEIHRGLADLSARATHALRVENERLNAEVARLKVTCDGAHAVTEAAKNNLHVVCERLQAHIAVGEENNNVITKLAAERNEARAMVNQLQDEKKKREDDALALIMELRRRAERPTTPREKKLRGYWLGQINGIRELMGWLDGNAGRDRPSNG